MPTEINQRLTERADRGQWRGADAVMSSARAELDPTTGVLARERRRWPAWAFALGAAVVALVLVGGILLLFQTDDGSVASAPEATDPPVAPSTAVSTTVVPTTEAPAATEVTTTTVTALAITPARLEVTWQQAPTQPAFGLDDFIWSVIEGGPGLVAVGGATDEVGYSDAAVWVSADGTTWEQAGDPDVFRGVPNTFGSDGNQVLNDVATGPGGLVAVGWVDTNRGDTEPPIWVSPDAVTWSRVTGNEDAFDPGDLITGVTRGGPGYVAVGSDAGGDAAAWVSADGRIWTNVEQDLGSGYERSVIEDVALTTSGLVAVGTAEFQGWYFGVGQPVVWTSQDGLTWNRSDLGSEPGALWSLVSAGDGAIAVGYTDRAAAVWTSADGSESWSSPLPVVGLDAELWFWSGLVDENRLMVVGVEYPEFPTGEYPFPGPLYAVAWASDDGGATWYDIGWTSDPEDGDFASTSDQRPAGFRDVIPFGDGLVAVGGTGNGSAPVWIGAWGN